MAAPMPAFEPPAAHDTADPDATHDHRPPCPFLRLPHDHCRGLWPRRRTPRPSTVRRRGQNRDAMTLATTSLHHPLAGEPRSRRRSTAIPVTANSDATPRTVPESSCRAQQQRPIRDSLAPICPQPRRPTHPPPKPLLNQIAINGEPLTSPRGFLLRGLSDAGFRHGCTGQRRASIRNPSRKQALPE